MKLKVGNRSLTPRRAYVREYSRGENFAIALIAFAFALFLIFGALPDQRRTVTEIETNFARDFATYAVIPAGEQVSISGKLTNNPTLENGVVAFRRDQLGGEGRGNQPYRWFMLESHLPDLNIAIDGGVVQTVSRGQVVLTGGEEAPVETVVTGDKNYGGQSIGPGTTRLHALKNGDVVIVTGVKQTGGELAVRDLLGDVTPENLERDSYVSSICPMIWIVIFLAMGVVAFRDGLKKK